VIRAVARAALALAVTLAISSASAPPRALAHAIVLESSPKHDAALAESPSRIVLRFNSRIEAALSRVTIETVNGRPVALPAAHDAGKEANRLVVPVGPLAPGTYIVRYRVLAADGHVTEGALRFSVKASP
jgi:methionine-rich copper-binding protein CopC